VRRPNVLNIPRPTPLECTICTARAPDAVFTVRTYATADTIEPARLVRASRHNAPGHSPTDYRIGQTWPKSGFTSNWATRQGSSPPGCILHQRFLGRAPRLRQEQP
jgi:hypothetical protein